MRGGFETNYFFLGVFLAALGAGFFVAIGVIVMTNNDMPDL